VHESADEAGGFLWSIHVQQDVSGDADKEAQVHPFAIEFEILHTLSHSPTSCNTSSANDDTSAAVSYNGTASPDALMSLSLLDGTDRYGEQYSMYTVYKQNRTSFLSATLLNYESMMGGLGLDMPPLMDVSSSQREHYQLNSSSYYGGTSSASASASASASSSPSSTPPPAYRQTLSSTNLCGEALLFLYWGPHHVASVQSWIRNDTNLGCGTDTIYSWGLSHVAQSGHTKEFSPVPFGSMLDIMHSVSTGKAGLDLPIDLSIALYIAL
jgi:hypothetical protein